MTQTMILKKNFSVFILRDASCITLSGIIIVHWVACIFEILEEGVNFFGVFEPVQVIRLGQNVVNRVIFKFYFLGAAHQSDPKCF